MKRFKDSNNLYKVSTAAGPPWNLNPFKVLDPGKLKMPTKGASGAWLLDKQAVKQAENAIRAVQAQKGTDEKIGLGAALITGGTSASYSVLQSLLSQSKDWQTVVPAIGVATGLATFWNLVKPKARATWIEMYPHMQNTLKDIMTKKYVVIEEIEGSRKKAVTDTYTLPQIVEQWNAAKGVVDGEWKVGKLKRRFADENEVAKLNQLFHHQYWSEVRDNLTTAGVIPGSIIATNIGAQMLTDKLTRDFENSPNKAAAQHVADETSKAPEVSKESPFKDMTQINGIFYKYEPDNFKVINGVKYYYVPAKKGYFKRQLPKGVKE